jgi:hypothetical protein
MGEMVRERGGRERGGRERGGAGEMARERGGRERGGRERGGRERGGVRDDPYPAPFCPYTSSTIRRWYIGGQEGADGKGSPPLRRSAAPI